MKPILGLAIVVGMVLAGCATTRVQHIVTQDGREYYCRPEDGKTNCYSRAMYFAKMQGRVGPTVADHDYLSGAAIQQAPSIGAMYSSVPTIVNSPPGTQR